MSPSVTLHKRCIRALGCAAGGLVSAGEKPISRARGAKLEEELGVLIAELKPHGCVLFEAPGIPPLGAFFSAVGMAPSGMQPEEVCRACALD